FQQQALNLTPPMFLLPLDFMQGQLTAFLAHQPDLQGGKLLTRPCQVGDGGQARDFRQRGKGHSGHDGLLLTRDQHMNDASSYLARKEPRAVALCALYPCKINWSRINEK